MLPASQLASCLEGQWCCQIVLIKRTKGIEFHRNLGQYLACYPCLAFNSILLNRINNSIELCVVLIYLCLFG